MNVTIENLGSCRKLIKLALDAAEVNETFGTVEANFLRNVKIPGFRPGKVPKEIILRNFSKDIEAEVRRRLVGDFYKKALAEHKIHVVSAPEVKEGNLARHEGFTVDFKVETAPDLELPPYKGLTVQKEARTVGEPDVDRGLDVLRQRGATFNDVERPAQAGDIVVVNYDGTSEGRPLTDFAPTARGLTHQDNFWMEIKPGHFIPGFTEQLEGASKGEKRTVQVDFPADFVSAQLSGRKGVYEVEIVQIKEKVLPEANEAFAKLWGADSIEKLREGIRRDLESELENNLRRNVRAQLIDALTRSVECELPASLVEGETRNIVYSIVAENQQRGVAKEMIDAQKDEIFNYASNSAKEKLKVNFLLSRIAEKEGIKVSQEELSYQVAYMAEQREMKPEKLVKDLQKTTGFGPIHEQILIAKVMAFLEKNAVIQEVPPAPQA